MDEGCESVQALLMFPALHLSWEQVSEARQGQSLPLRCTDQTGSRARTGWVPRAQSPGGQAAEATQLSFHPPYAF
jgi:hypothetical protein